MHPIPVRTMKFAVPGAGEFHPLYIAGNSVLSYNHTAFGLYVALRQRFQLATFPLGMRLHSMLPGYTPRKHHVPDSIAKLSARFTQIAQSVQRLRSPTRTAKPPPLPTSILEFPPAEPPP